MTEQVENRSSAARIKYSIEFLLRVRSELRKEKARRGSIDSFSKVVKSSEEVSDKLQIKPPGHILREHKTLLTDSIVRRRSDETPLKASRNMADSLTPIEKSLSFVSDFERSEVMKMRERVKLSLSAHKVQSSESKKSDGVKSESVKQQIRRKDKNKKADDVKEGMDFNVFYREYTLGGNKDHARAAFHLLQERYGPNWIELFHFQPYYYPIIVPVPYVEKKSEIEGIRTEEPRWSFGRTPELSASTPDEVVPDLNHDDHVVKMNRVIERLQLPIQIGTPSKTHDQEPSELDESTVKDTERVDSTTVLSCFRVPAAKLTQGSLHDPRMPQKGKQKPRSVNLRNVREKTSDSSDQVYVQKIAHRSSNSSDSVNVSNTSQNANNSPKKTEPQTKTSAPNPFSLRKRTIMPIMRSKKFVIWLHVTNHPEPPYEHSYLRELNSAEEVKLLNIVQDIPNRPDPIDPSITDDDYFAKVDEWNEMLEAISPFVAPRPEGNDSAASPAQNKTQVACAA